MGKKKTRPFKTFSVFPKRKTCSLCKTSNKDVSLLGEIYQMSDVIVHYFCLLSSSKIEQNGKDEQGILGFFVRDIKKEITRGKSLKCEYCKKSGATVNCVEPSCKINFHLPCGLEKGSLHQYFSEFKSFCSKHKPKQTIPAKVKKAKGECPMCLTPVTWNSEPHIWSPCCRPNVLMHKICCQKYALNSGYACKCPLCNNKDDFRQALQDYGIYVPDQDASWEIDDSHRFDDGTVVECMASKMPGSKCLCPRGPRYSQISSSQWLLVSCGYCGSGMHIGCLPLDGPPLDPDDYKCEGCAPVQERFKSLPSPDNNKDPNNPILRRLLHPIAPPPLSPSPEVDVVVISDSEDESNDIPRIIQTCSISMSEFYGSQIEDAILNDDEGSSLAPIRIDSSESETEEVEPPPPPAKTSSSDPVTQLSVTIGGVHFDHVPLVTGELSISRISGEHPSATSECHPGLPSSSRSSPPASASLLPPTSVGPSLKKRRATLGSNSDSQRKRLRSSKRPNSSVDVSNLIQPLVIDLVNGDGFIS